MTRNTFASILAFGLILGFMILPARARADDWDQSTKLTFHEPFQLPGNRVLPAGTYWFMLVTDTGAPTKFVRIFNADRSMLYGTFLTIPTMRADLTEDEEFTFAEPVEGRPPVLLRWFYPDHQTGHEFVYSPEKEAKLNLSAKMDVIARNAMQP